MTGTFDPLPPLVAENFKHAPHSEPDAYDVLMQIGLTRIRNKSIQRASSP